ncbi:Trp biosynthesis-associated membrane protein [Asanoa sp. WMMD1127]|uniref:Trp biosynthesis-associated membrane protein n=1 Tax=Asanoa sp. WMMD1127 TaxID=3016107 RepID=UPI002417795A|nr:Trp biosynthesis-associated membrane protein [Asanoa sp. WMMD1127]MDG4827026.1 Trp biosynthesis-associated membrane protein [Asanoa sp. WMMD1127]
MTDGRRRLTSTVLLCAVGAGLAFVGAGRTWERGYTHGPTPASPDQTGADLVPGLSALALVALAGAGALLATRGWARRAVGALVLLVGLALVALPFGRVFDASTAWPALTAVGGLLVVAGGLAAALAGHRWPGMGARYERSPRSVGGTTDTWNALDRGEDPTLR